MKEKLALCPFCTSTNLEIVHAVKRYFVQCNACDAAGGSDPTEEDAIFSWNSRPFSWQDIKTNLPPKDFYIIVNIDLGGTIGSYWTKVLWFQGSVWLTENGNELRESEFITHWADVPPSL